MSHTDETPDGPDDSEPADLTDVIEAVREVIEADERRVRAVRRLAEAPPKRRGEEVCRVRKAMIDERERLDRAEHYLELESERTEEFVQQSEYLSAEQAIRHRAEAVEKLEKHNESLRAFCRELRRLIAVLEWNLERVEEGCSESELVDGSVHLRRAKELLREHNESVAGLGTNLRIVSAYAL